MAQPVRRVTSFPFCRPINPEISHVQGTSPSRVWEMNYNGLWSSRAWWRGEREEYIRTVLNRHPHSEELHG